MKNVELLSESVVYDESYSIRPDCDDTHVYVIQNTKMQDFQNRGVGVSAFDIFMETIY